MPRPHRVIIIGGGISGLATAYFLSQLSRFRQAPFEITILESQERLGGVIQTFPLGQGFRESAADAFYGGGASGASTLELCRKLGLETDLVEANPCFRRFFVLRNQKLFPAPSLSNLFSPQNTLRLLGSSYLSPNAKGRILLEPWIAARKKSEDESVAVFLRRRFGERFYQEMAEPLLQGVYMADPEKLSMQAVFPGLAAMEQTQGSLGAAFLKKILKNKKHSPSEFFTFKNGLETLLHALVKALPACEIRRNARVRECRREGSWGVCLENGETIQADALCLAMTTYQAAPLLERSLSELAQDLRSIRHFPITSVFLSFQTKDVLRLGLDFGFMVPFRPKEIFSSLKCLGQTPDKQSVCFRAFVAGDQAAQDDETMKRKMLESLSRNFKITAQPKMICVDQYPFALPLYEVGHGDRIAMIQKKLETQPGLYLTGNSFCGFGIADCVHRVRETAQRIHAALKN